MIRYSVYDLLVINRSGMLVFPLALLDRQGLICIAKRLKKKK